MPNRGEAMRRLAALLATLAPAVAQDLAIELIKFPGTSQLGRAEAIVEGPDDRLWFAFAAALRCHDGTAMASIELAPRADGVPAAHLRCLAIAPDQGLLVGANNGLWRVPPGGTSGEPLPVGGNEPVHGIVVATDGIVWLRSTLLLRGLRPDGSALDVPRPEGCRGMIGMQAHGRGGWVWDDRRVWRLMIDADGPRWSEPLVFAAVRGVWSHGDELEVLADGQALHVDARGQREPSRRLGAVSAAALDFARFSHAGDTAWLIDGMDLWQPEPVGPWHRVRLYHHGDGLGEAPTCVLVDRQGLLWVGTDHAAYRGYRVPGIDNFVCDALYGDRVTAIAEFEDSMLLGTVRGALLRQTEARWHPEATPWQQDRGRSPSGITCLLVTHGEATGPERLFVGTSSRGLWRRESAGWERIAAHIQDVHALAIDADGRLWCATAIGVEVLTREGDHVATASIGAPGRRAPGSRVGAMLPHGGGMLLASHRRGLLLAENPDTCRSVGHAWVDDSVLSLARAETGVFVSSIGGLWSVQPDTGVRELLISGPRTESTRGLGALPDGSLWLTRGHQLLHFEPRTRAVRSFMAGYGAHPRPYTHRSACVTDDGAVWFGTMQGCTRIAPDVHRSMRWPLRLLGTHVRFGDQRRQLADGPGPWQVPGDAASFALQARLLDRSSDDPLPQTVLLRDPTTGREVVAVEHGFVGTPPGDYEALVAVSLPTGATERLPLGRLTVQPPPSRWPTRAAIAGLILVTLLALQRFWALHRARRRRVWFDRLVAAGAADQDVLDIAFLTVAVAEQCMHEAHANHASVWLRVDGTTPRVCLAEIGQRDAAAAERVHRCSVAGIAVDPTLRVADAGDDRALVATLGDARPLQFELLLRPIRNLPAALIERLHATLAPVRAALHKQAWLRRLESGMVDRSAELEADVHDLRGPLTALRLASHQLAKLVESRGDTPLLDVAGTIARTTERIVKGIEAMAMRSRDGSQLDLHVGDVAAVLRERIATLALVAANKRIRIVFEADSPGPLEAVFDPIWLTRVVDNVVGNAIKYAPHDSCVRVQASTTPAGLTLHVDDSGPGFTERDLQHAFVPGMTGSARPTAGESQTGMGLWIVRGALRAMGGDVTIGSAPSGGARVSLALPRQHSPSPRA